MIVTIIDEIGQFFERIPDFLEKYSSHPFFWIILLLVLIAITFFAVNRLGDK